MDLLSRQDRWARRIVLGTAVLIAAVSARPYAGGWNDGSRLATVESIVDYGTLSIDRSNFVNVPPLDPNHESPYPRDYKLLQVYGTKDKLFIDGHFYSDKSPVPALPMAAVYQLWRWCGGPSAVDRPDWFCLLETWTSSGVAYVIGIVCLYGIGRRLELSPLRSLGVTLSFALGTIALPYAQHVNNHIQIFAVAALLFHSLLNGVADGWPVRRLVWIGTLAGIGYTIDLAAGPLLCLTAGFYLLVATPVRLRTVWVVAAALPWVACHHAINYGISGCFGPANANPAYFEWPGSPFSEKNMTGTWHHSSLPAALVYALDMLFGKKGFFPHNLMLFMPLLCLPWLLRRRIVGRSVVIAGMVWAAATWLLYAATSNNLSGSCCSVRWLVPLLVPGFVGLCLTLKSWPETISDATVLAIGSVTLGVFMCKKGPWDEPHLTSYWVIYAATLVIWGAVHLRAYVRKHGLSESTAEEPRHIDEMQMSKRAA